MEIEHIRYITNKAINYLINKNSSQGHWEDIRSTAISVFALEQVYLKETLSPQSQQTVLDTLTDAKSWLFGQARRESRGISWNSEVWDTALSVLALSRDEQHRDKVELAISWLKDQRSILSNSWYEELWETILAAIALIRYEQSLTVRKFRDVDWIDSTVAWICHFPSEENGMFMTPHYSGLLIWLLVELQDAKLVSFKSFTLLHNKASNALEWAVLDTKENSKLWSEYIYANSYLLYAATRFERLQRKPLGMEIKLIEKWYTDNQSADGCFEDYEDTALAILSLSSLIVVSEYKERPIYDISRIRNSCPTLNCFIGYSGKSSSLATQIKENIRKDFSHIQIFDWEWDFEIGNHLFGEIENMCNKCQLAIFLLTKDDFTINDAGGFQSSPRDNVIFEVGFFASKLGFNQTIIIVEKGTKIPSDLGGILYISFENSSDLSKIVLQLSRHLKKLTANEAK